MLYTSKVIYNVTADLMKKDILGIFHKSTVSFSLQPPAYKKSNGVVKRYQLTIIQRKYGSRDPTEVGLRRIDIVKHLAPDRRNYTFSNLTPWSKYKLTLAAYNTDDLKNRNFDVIDNGIEITVDEAGELFSYFETERQAPPRPKNL